MKSMTYGELPTREEFNAAFSEWCETGKYSIVMGRSDSAACEDFKLGDGDWSDDALWTAITEIVADFNAKEHEDPSAEMRMDIVSAIMGTLGFEWI